jgi:hypothetical protein
MIAYRPAPVAPTRRSSAAWLLLLIAALLAAGVPVRPFQNAGHLVPDLAAAARPGLPLSFTPNAGQADPNVRFLAQGGAYTLALHSDGVDVRFAGGGAREAADLRVRFVGAQPAPTVEGLAPQPGVVSYFRGADPARWLSGLPTYAGVAYRGLYPGVDLIYRRATGALKSEFVVAAGADPTAIRWVYAGAQRVEIAADGGLTAISPAGALREAAPVAYQEVGGERRAVAAAFVLDGENQVRFRLGAYDPAQPLVIDPTLVYATFLGGSDGDPFREYVNDIAVDAAGNMIVTGMTPATDFPTANPIQTNQPGFDAFVAKISADGQTLLYATYLGGAGSDEGYGVAVDANGAAYVAGETGSNDFPTLTPFQGDQGGVDAFVVKLIPDGQLVYATYLGGANLDGARDIAVDDQGRVVVTGVTASTGFPTRNPLMGPQFALNGASSDAFVTQLSADGQALVFSTYLGGGNNENIEGRSGVALDGVGNIYVVGTTRSTDFPAVNARQTAYGGGRADAFLARIRGDGSALDYATYLGGAGEERGNGVAADAAGNAYVTGQTWSADFPTANPWQATYVGILGDAFVGKFTPSGAAAYVTYLGGSNGDRGNAIAVNAAGEAYVTGCAGSSNFPLVNPLQSFPSIIGCAAFVTRFSADGSALRYSTLLGGGEGFGITWARGSAYVGGEAGPHFVSKHPLKPPTAATGRGEAFVVQMDDLDYLFLPLMTRN